MGINILDNFKMVPSMVKEPIIFLMEINTMVNFSIIRGMETEK